MPCQYDHPGDCDDSLKEAEIRVCRLYEFALSSLGRPIPSLVMTLSRGDFNRTDSRRLDQHTRELCDLCRDLLPEERELLLYNGRNRLSRDLANWWDDHREADERRRKNEEDKATKTERIEGLLAVAPSALRPDLKVWFLIQTPAEIALLHAAYADSRSKGGPLS